MTKKIGGFLILLLAAAAGAQGAAPRPWPARVLLTNDNGIDDAGLVELARAFAPVAETVVVAPRADRSGTSNLMTAPRSGGFHVERRALGEGIQAWALDGTPADCVLFALSGPLRDDPPDLVVSGINGGANLGDDWFGSGTIGAARAAAYMGIPALAISGLEDDDPAAVEAAVTWVVEFARHPVVRGLVPPQYLTVSLPITGIRGISVVRRARGIYTGRSVPGSEPGMWSLELRPDPERAPEDSDVRAVAEGRIAIVPMRVDEFDPELHAALTRASGTLPPWKAPAPGGSRCRSGFGAMLDDAEDESGREWGVLVEEILPGGKAEAMGLRTGDVIVSLNGAALASPPRSPEDPDERFVRLLAAVDCGETVTLEYRRGAKLLTGSFQIPGP